MMAAIVASWATRWCKSASDLRQFSSFFHYRFTRKALFMGFSGCRAQKKAPVTAIAAPTALRPKATCLPCHSGICKLFLFVYKVSHRVSPTLHHIRGYGCSVEWQVLSPERWQHLPWTVQHTNGERCLTSLLEPYQKNGRPAHHCGSLPGLHIKRITK